MKNPLILVDVIIVLKFVTAQYIAWMSHGEGTINGNAGIWTLYIPSELLTWGLGC